jgi:hypothetical protein
VKAWHHEQTRPDSCVAACICIVHRFRGEAIPEDDARAETQGGRASIAAIAAVARARRIRAAEWQGDVEEVRLALTRGEIVITQVLGHPYVRALRRHHADLASRHGDLCAPGDFNGPPHSVAIVRREPGALLVLDPYYPAERQPLRLTDEDFDACFGAIAFAIAP